MKLTIALFITSITISSQVLAKRGGKRGPPPEAITACESKSEGDSCSFTGKRGEASGTCVTKDSSKPMACKPARKK